MDRAADARRVAIASAIGTTIEWYDFFIYGTAAAVVLRPRFCSLRFAPIIPAGSGLCVGVVGCWFSGR